MNISSEVRVSFAPKAQQDLTDLHSYIASHSPVRARTYLRELAAACRKLGDMPEMGRFRDDLGEGRRSFSFRKRQTIMYQVRPDKVEILRIFSAGQDFGALLGDD